MPTANPDFSPPRVLPLLKLANVKYTAEARTSLVAHLKIAWADVQLTRQAREQRIPQDLFESLNDSIKHTQRLLRRLERNLPDIATDKWAVLNGRAITPGKMFDEVPLGATWVAFNRQQMLDRLLRDIARYNPTRSEATNKSARSSSSLPRPLIFSGNTRLKSLPAIPKDRSPYFARDFTRSLRVNRSVVAALKGKLRTK
jgi:hypothetical protein